MASAFKNFTGSEKLPMTGVLVSCLPVRALEAARALGRTRASLHPEAVTVRQQAVLPPPPLWPRDACALLLQISRDNTDKVKALLSLGEVEQVGGPVGGPFLEWLLDSACAGTSDLSARAPAAAPPNQSRLLLPTRSLSHKQEANDHSNATKALNTMKELFGGSSDTAAQHLERALPSELPEVVQGIPVLARVPAPEGAAEGVATRMAAERAYKAAERAATVAQAEAGGSTVIDYAALAPQPAWRGDRSAAAGPSQVRRGMGGSASCGRCGGSGRWCTLNPHNLRCPPAFCPPAVCLVPKPCPVPLPATPWRATAAGRQPGGA